MPNSGGKSSGGQRVPQRVTMSSESKSAQPSRMINPWYRHTVWFVPTMACVAFVVLIFGVLGARRVIVWLRQPAIAMETATEDEDAAFDKATKEIAELWESRIDDDRILEVLPPLAAKQPGRKLPKLLLVGPDAYMFQSLEEAIQLAIGGDIVEIRVNGAMAVTPGKIAWTGAEGCLVIRGGKGFQPVVMRKGDEAGPLLTVGLGGPESTANCIIQNLGFVNLKGDGARDEVYGHEAIVSSVPLFVRHCLFVSDRGTLGLQYYPADPHTELRVENCYFRAVTRPIPKDSGVGLSQGRLTLRNNLFIGFTTSIGIGGGIDRLSAPQSHVVIQHNTFAHNQLHFMTYARTIIDCRDNLFCHHPFQYFCGLGSYVNSAEEAQQRLEYHGRNNLFFDTKWAVWQGWQAETGTIESWQWLTASGEQNPVVADPAFADPSSALAAKDRLLPPSAFALQPNSPARSAGTDGNDIGADLSLIPVPPPWLENLVAGAIGPK